jgi:hypothetical protein
MDLFDPEQKALYERRKQLAEDVGSGAAARRGAEAGLKAQMAAAGAGRGSAAQRMRGLARAGEAGVRGAAAQGAGAAATTIWYVRTAGQGRFGMMKSDKAGRLGFYQKSRGLDVAEKLLNNKLLLQGLLTLVVKLLVVKSIKNLKEKMER